MKPLLISLLLILVTCLFSTDSFAQNENFNLEISMENANLWKQKDVLVKVKLTNKSENFLYTKTLKPILFFFSTCSIIDKCDVRGDKYISSIEMPPKLLKKDESFDFEVNLADLYWIDAISSQIDFNHPKNFTIIPIANHYLYAKINSFSSNQFLTYLKATTLQ